MNGPSAPLAIGVGLGAFLMLVIAVAGMVRLVEWVAAYRGWKVVERESLAFGVVFVTALIGFVLVLARSLGEAILGAPPG